jgi:hypothetical protein
MSLQNSRARQIYYDCGPLGYDAVQSDTDVSEEPVASVLRAENPKDGSSRFLRNVNLYQTKGRHVTEDSSFNIHECEEFQSYKLSLNLPALLHNASLISFHQRTTVPVRYLGPTTLTQLPVDVYQRIFES